MQFSERITDVGERVNPFLGVVTRQWPVNRYLTHYQTQPTFGPLDQLLGRKPTNQINH